MRKEQKCSGMDQESQVLDTWEDLLNRQIFIRPRKKGNQRKQERGWKCKQSRRGVPTSGEHRRLAEPEGRPECTHPRERWLAEGDSRCSELQPCDCQIRGSAQKFLPLKHRLKTPCSKSATFEKKIQISLKVAENKRTKSPICL